MNITIHGVTHSFATEAELLAFCMALRFEIRSERGQRRYFVDGQEVSEDQYVGAVEASALDLPA
jgi:hypothetical protein